MIDKRKKDSVSSKINEQMDHLEHKQMKMNDWWLQNKLIFSLTKKKHKNRNWGGEVSLVTNNRWRGDGRTWQILGFETHAR